MNGEIDFAERISLERTILGKSHYQNGFHCCIARTHNLNVNVTSTKPYGAR